jgi:hypothetical protein
VRGLKGCTYLDKSEDPKNPTEGKDEREAATFGEKLVDSVYLDAPEYVVLEVGTGTESIYVLVMLNRKSSDAQATYVDMRRRLVLESCWTIMYKCIAVGLEWPLLCDTIRTVAMKGSPCCRCRHCRKLVWVVGLRSVESPSDNAGKLQELRMR